MSTRDKEWCNWDDLHKTGRVGMHPGEKAYIESLGGGEDVEIADQKGGDKITKADLDNDVKNILNGFKARGLGQPSVEDIKSLYPELNKTNEEWDTIEKSWDTSINDWFKTAQQPIDNADTDWANGKSFRETLSKNERAEYDKTVQKFDKETM